MTRLIFLGAPGAGKGTQAQILAQDCHIPHVSTGEILRDAVSKETDLGKQAQGYMSAGELVPDELLLGLIRERLQHPDAMSGWILDGFPRNISQANFLDSLLQEIEQPLDFAINLDVPDEVLITRLLKRGRADDTEEVIRNRLNVYRAKTETLIEFYRNQQKLASIDGNRTMESVQADLRHLIAA